MRPNSDQSYKISEKFGKKINQNCSSGLVKSSFGNPAIFLLLKYQIFCSNLILIYAYLPFSWNCFGQSVPLDIRKTLSKSLSKTPSRKSDHFCRDILKFYSIHISFRKHLRKCSSENHSWDYLVSFKNFFYCAQSGILRTIKNMFFMSKFLFLIIFWTVDGKSAVGFYLFSCS